MREDQPQTSRPNLIGLERVQILRANRSAFRRIEAIVEICFRRSADGPVLRDCRLVDIPYQNACDNRPLRARLIGRAVELSLQETAKVSDLVASPRRHETGG